MAVFKAAVNCSRTLISLLYTKKKELLLF